MDDAEYAFERRLMVTRQLMGRGIQDPRVLDAMQSIPRHTFLPTALRPRAYEDCALGIGEGQTISQPYMVALMTELLELQPTDRVLEIGTGSGYQTSILATLAREVISIERQPVLADEAEKRLRELGFENISIHVGDGSKGCAAKAPFEAILVTAGAPHLPSTLGEQLTMGGRLVCPVGPRKVQELVRLTRRPDGVEQRNSIQCTFVPLIGEEGWSEDAR